MGNPAMPTGKRTMAGVTISATTMACGDPGQGTGSVVATGAAIVFFVIAGGDRDPARQTLGPGMTTRAISRHGYRRGMALATVPDRKETMAGFATIGRALAAGRADQGPGLTVTTGAGVVFGGGGAINHNAAGRAIGPDMAERTGLRHSDPVGVIDRVMDPTAKTAMTGLTVGAAPMPGGKAEQKALGVMATAAALMNDLILRVNRHPGQGAFGLGVTGGANRRHGYRRGVINAAKRGMKGQPIIAMAGLTVARAAGGQTDQHPAPV